MCPTCNGAVYLADDTMCRACVCDSCHRWAADFRAIIEADPFNFAQAAADFPPHECTRRTCSWAQLMGTAEG
ncbi:hypothetical protein [Streptomyces mayteni]